ncbi:hypothetical protein [Hamadaea tsunoensis]|uniref:hypothetical protein n=1 Tax=Hamadaea tsunoensis TaxID=53368 RepID=UPI000414A6F0|nr:hypothetical protein [Hamadaea tsunoensis]
MLPENVDAELARMAADPRFPHRAAARRAERFRARGDVSDLLAVLDDPHPCGTTEILFAMAGARQPWLNWVPMPAEAICRIADEVGARRAKGEDVVLTGLGVTAAEPASATTAFHRVAGPVAVEIGAFPAPDIRVPLRRGTHMPWRYDGILPVPAVAAPSPLAVEVLHQVADQPWPSPLSGYLQAAPLGELPLADLLGLLAHLPGPPDTARWRHLAQSTPTYWYRLLQPWVCLGLLHHRPEQPWATSDRRAALIDLAFGVEDWTTDAALFALVTAAFREPGHRSGVRELVRGRLDAAIAAPRLVTIETSLAQLMLITPGCRADDRRVAHAALARAGRSGDESRRRRWWRRR